ncbi:MAG: hypothetical protein ACI4QM_05120 [Alphaproteobacteria bacterium]
MQLTAKQEVYLNMMACRDTAKLLRTQIGASVAQARLKKGWTLEKASEYMREKYHHTFSPMMLQRIELGKYDLKLWDVVVLVTLYDFTINIPFKPSVL